MKGKSIMPKSISKTKMGYGNNKIGYYKTKGGARKAFNKAAKINNKIAKFRKMGPELQEMKHKDWMKKVDMYNKAAVGTQAANILGSGASAIRNKGQERLGELAVADRFLQQVGASKANTGKDASTQTNTSTSSDATAGWL